MSKSGPFWALLGLMTGIVLSIALWQVSLARNLPETMRWDGKYVVGEDIAAGIYWTEGVSSRGSRRAQTVDTGTY